MGVVYRCIETINLLSWVLIEASESEMTGLRGYPYLSSVILNGVKHPAHANSLICKSQTLHSVQGDKFNKEIMSWVV